MRFYGEFEGLIFKHIVMNNMEINRTFQTITLLLSLLAWTAYFLNCDQMLETIMFVNQGI